MTPGEKNEAALFQVKGFTSAFKCDGALYHVEHFVLGLMRVAAWFFTLFRDILQNGGAAARPYFTSLSQ